MGYSTFFVKFLVGVHGFELGVQGAWFQEYGVPGFGSTGCIVSTVPGYIVSHYPPLTLLIFEPMAHCMHISRNNRFSLITAYWG